MNDKNTYVVLAPGRSLSEELAETAAKKYKCIAVTEAYRLAPNAHAIVAQDAEWWRLRTEALKRRCEKWSSNYVFGVSRIRPNHWIRSGSNSGLAALYVALTEYEASRVLLLGLDLRGTHFFGEYADMKNPDEEQFVKFRTQFADFARSFATRAEIINCTEGSTLDCFPYRPLNEFVEPPAALETPTLPPQESVAVESVAVE